MGVRRDRLDLWIADQVASHEEVAEWAKSL